MTSRCVTSGHGRSESDRQSIPYAHALTGYLLFALPIYYARLRYGWRSPELWCE